VRGVLALAATLALGGCSLGPAASSRSSKASATQAVAQTTGTVPATQAVAETTITVPATQAVAKRTHEVPTPAPRQAVAGGWRTPAEAVQEFATYYVNWNYRTVALHLRALSEVSVGQARSMLSTAADQVGRDYELRRGRVGNRGVVEALAPVRGHEDQYAVITRERTTAANTDAYRGLAPAWHVALATVTRVRGLWVLSSWQPES
jgi:hypothetical protein